MAKFCGNCGRQLDDNAKVCGYCGTPFSGNIKKTEAIKPIIDPQTKASILKKVKYGIGAIAVVILAVIIFNIISSFTGYNALIRKTMTAFEKYDVDTLVSLSSDFYYYTEEGYIEDYFERNVGDVLDTFESYVGENYRLTYKVNDIHSMPDRKRNEIIEDMTNYNDAFNVDIIDDFVVAELTITAKKGSETSDRNLDIVMTKEEGVWKILYFD